jgi:uncharacterized protein (TIGR01777 family)
MKILLVGGSGTIGKHLIEDWLLAGHQVQNLSRSSMDALVTSAGSLLQQQWDGQTIPDTEFRPDLVVNLAGAGIADHAWTPDRRKLILDSRIKSTRACVEYIRKNTDSVKLFINSSAVGFYGAHREEICTEESKPGNDFLAEVCEAWENEAKRAPVRTVLLRTSVVISKHGGALPKMLPVFKAGIGGWLGNGRQPFPWIDGREFSHLIQWLMDHPEASGPYNICSPQSINNKQFSQALSEAVHRPCLFAVPAFVLKIMLGSRADLVLKGQNQVPERLTREGYVFKYDKISEALHFHTR